MNIIQAQVEQYNYVGVQTFESGEFTSYHLDFEFFQDNVQGRAIVDYGGPDETLYYIKGTYKNDILTFRAPFLIWTKSDLPQRDYCVLRFRESIKNLKTVKAFSGPYTSKRSQGEECSKGLLILSRMFQIEPSEPEEKEIVEISKPLQEQTEVSKPKTAIIPKVNTPISQLRSTPIKKDENLNVFVTNKKVILVIYDAGKVDDDRISLTINGEEILTNYSIDSAKKEIKITLEKGKSVIEVTALNEGTSSPNTVKVEIKDGYKTISTRTSLKTGEKASLTILNN